jgi:hypothetical protein
MRQKARFPPLLAVPRLLQPRKVHELLNVKGFGKKCSQGKYTSFLAQDAFAKETPKRTSRICTPQTCTIGYVAKIVLKFQTQSQYLVPVSKLLLSVFEILLWNR